MSAEFIVHDQERVIERLEMTDEEFAAAVDKGCRQGDAITMKNRLGLFYIVERVQQPYWDMEGFIILNRAPIQ